MTITIGSRFEKCDRCHRFTECKYQNRETNEAETVSSVGLRPDEFYVADSVAIEHDPDGDRKLVDAIMQNKETSASDDVIRNLKEQIRSLKSNLTLLDSKDIIKRIHDQNSDLRKVYKALVRDELDEIFLNERETKLKQEAKKQAESECLRKCAITLEKGKIMWKKQTYAERTKEN